MKKKREWYFSHCRNAVPAASAERYGNKSDEETDGSHAYPHPTHAGRHSANVHATCICLVGRFIFPCRTRRQI
jgi:hypothetical protein